SLLRTVLRALLSTIQMMSRGVPSGGLAQISPASLLVLINPYQRPSCCILVQSISENATLVAKLQIPRAEKEDVIFLYSPSTLQRARGERSRFSQILFKIRLIIFVWGNMHVGARVARLLSWTLSRA